MLFNQIKLERVFKQLTHHSLKLRKYENVLVEAVNVPEEVLLLLFREIRKSGAYVFSNIKYDKLMREIALTSTSDYFDTLKFIEIYQLKKMDAFIGIRSSINSNEFFDVPRNQIRILSNHYYNPVHLKYRNKYLRSVFLRIPNESVAQRAGISSQLLLNQFYNSCLINYPLLNKHLGPFVKLLKKTDKIRILGPGKTDLQFSIKNMPVLKCTGRRNMPDGELQTAPVKFSVNGIVEFNIPSTYLGTTFHFINLLIKDGKIIEFETLNNNKFNSIINIDKGSKYFGEFAFGLNSNVKYPLNDILFDEKMQGTIHLALGNAYEFCDNGNRSAIHWDLIIDQNRENGGGKIYADDKLIRKDGKFVVEELKVLNKI